MNVEGIIARHYDTIKGRGLADPNVQLGSPVIYVQNGASRELFVRYIFLRGIGWKILASDPLNQETKIVPQDSAPSGPPLARTAVNQGDEYVVKIQDSSGNYRLIKARVITQSSLSEDSDTYMRDVETGNIICSAKTASLKRANPLRRSTPYSSQEPVA